MIPHCASRSFSLFPSAARCASSALSHTARCFSMAQQVSHPICLGGLLLPHSQCHGSPKLRFILPPYGVFFFLGYEFCVLIGAFSVEPREVLFEGFDPSLPELVTHGVLFEFYSESS